MKIETININNFHISTHGVFDEIKAIPNNFKCFFKSKQSRYYTNEDASQIVRVSNHWGNNIKLCNWFLKRNESELYENISAFDWSKKYGKKKYIGIIKIANLEVLKICHE